jgi:hypothetical protein
MALSRDQILTADDCKREAVEVPEWGGTVYVATMTGTARDAWEQSLVVRRNGKSETNLENMRARLAVACIVDESGARLFKDEDAAALGAKSSRALERLAKVAQRLNGIGDAELEIAEGN